MSTYKLILEVTCEQELAIKLLFSDRGWKFLTHGVIAKANNIRNPPGKPRKFLVKHTKNLPIPQQPKAALNSYHGGSLQEKYTASNLKSKPNACSVNTKEKNELQLSPNRDQPRSSDIKEPLVKPIPRVSEINPVNIIKTQAVQPSLPLEIKTGVKDMPKVTEPSNHVPNKAVPRCDQVEDSTESVHKAIESNAAEPNLLSVQAIKTSDLTKTDVTDSPEREISVKPKINNKPVIDDNDITDFDSGHDTETKTQELTSDLDESTEENLCITNLQRKKKLLEKTALAKNGGQKRLCVSTVSREPPVKEVKSKCLIAVDNDSNKSRNEFVKDKFNINIPASKIVRTLKEQEHVISECVRANVDRLTDIQTLMPKVSDVKNSTGSVSEYQTNVPTTSDIHSADPVLKNCQTSVAIEDIKKTEDKKPLPSLETLLPVNNDAENFDDDMQVDMASEVNDLPNNQKSEPVKQIHVELESDKMCQTEYDAPPKQVGTVINKYALLEENGSYKLNDENDTQTLNKSIGENITVDNQCTNPTNLSSNNMSVKSSLGNLNKNLKMRNTSEAITRSMSDVNRNLKTRNISEAITGNPSGSSVTMYNPKMVTPMNVMKEKSMNVMNKVDSVVNNVSKAVNEQHTMATANIDLKQLQYSTKKKESSVEMEKRVLDLLPKDVSTQVRQMLSVHRSWTDPTTIHRLSCPYCKHELKNPIYFVRHLEKHVKREYDCPSCGKQFGNRRLLKAHMDTVVNGTLNCDLCDFRASNACMLRGHKKSEHKSPAGLQCHLCATMVKCQSYLTVHLKTVHGVQNGKYECNICGKKCARPKWLEKHMKEHKEKLPTPTCSVCNKTFTDKKSLRKHFMSKHKEKDNLCKECGKTFVSSSKLLVHERTHSGEKPFACDQCDYRTTQKSNLTMHLKTHDRGENTLVSGLGVMSQKKAKLKESLGTSLPMSNISQHSLSQSHKPLNDNDSQNKSTGSHLHIQTGSPHQGALQSTVNNFREPNVENSSHTASESQNYLGYDENAMTSNYYNTAVTTGSGYETGLANKDGYSESYMNQDQAFGNDYGNSVNALRNMQQYTATLYGNEELPDSTDDDDDDDDDDTSESEMEDSYEKDTDDDGEMTFQELLGRDDIPPAKSSPQNSDTFTPTDSAFTDKQTFELTSALHALHPDLQNTSSNIGMYGTNQFNQFADNGVNTYHQSFNYDMPTGDSDPLMNIQKYEQGFEELLRGSSYDVSATTSIDVTNQQNTTQQNVYNQVAVTGGKGVNSENYSKYDGANDPTNGKDWSMYNVPNNDPAACNSEQLSSFYQAFQGMSYQNYDTYYGDGTNNMAPNMAYHNGAGNHMDSNSLAYQSGNHMSGNQMSDMATGQYAYGNNYSGISQHAPAYQMSKTAEGNIPVPEMGYNGDLGYNSMNDMSGQAYQTNQTNYNQMLEQVNQSYMDLHGPVSYLDQMHTES